MKKNLFIAAMLTVAAVFTSSCNNSEEPAQVPAPEIVSISPDSAPVGEAVTITGANFSAEASMNAVTFGTASASVTSATETELVVIVPELPVGEVEVVVTVGGKASEPKGFTVVSDLLVSSITASIVTTGEVVTVEGAGFEDAVITIGETAVTPTVLYDDFFKFEMPSLAKGEHQITISKYGSEVKSEKFMYYSLPQYEVSVWAGDYTQAMTAGALSSEAQFNFPEDLAWDSNGNLWVSHRSGKAVSCIDMTAKTNGNSISTGANTFGIAWCGNSLYAANKNTSKLGIVTNSVHANFDSDYKFNSAMDVILSLIHI